MSTITDIMLDLETLSSQPAAAIISIGACTFRTDGRAQTAGERRFISINVDMASTQRAGGHIDAHTIKWWFQQSDAARAAAIGGQPADIDHALHEMRSWLLMLGDVRVWGNGASFDNVVLRQAYERLHMDAPWEFRADRCYRTLKGLRPEILMTRMGTSHSAYDDALSQAIHAERIFAALLPAPSVSEER